MRAILTLNVGSSTVKCGWFDAKTLDCKSRITLKSKDEITGWIAKQEGELSAIVHRVVHGGILFHAPVIIDNNVLSQLKTLIPLAPLHQPHNIALIESMRKAYPDIPNIACFDTAFHHSIAPLEREFALPRTLTDEGLIRYGFHGLSYEYIASILPSMIGDAAKKNVIALHLGNGSSMCAIKNGKSVATTMGFSTLDGLMMGTRCGTLDVGVLLYLAQEKGMSIADISHLLYSESGLKGTSGISADMRELETSIDPSAAHAIDLYCLMAARHLGSLIISLGGLDLLIFTGGIGENSARVRAKICNYLSWLDIVLDSDLNQQNELRISAQYSKKEVWVLPTNEEKVMAEAAQTIFK
jgi:acetate kinase